MKYSDLTNITMTLQECKQYLAIPGKELFIIISIFLILITLLLFWIINDLMNCQKFIKENKLQKQFQQFKKDNKGL
jgi:hypothetical protein